MENNNQKSSILHEKKYDIVFIGGGPSTLSYLSYLFKNKQEHVFSTTNILIIEKNDTFGSGCLGKYGINSNTSGEGFIRIISFPDEKIDSKSNLSPNKKLPYEKQPNYDSKNIYGKSDQFKVKYQPLPMFNDFYHYSPVQTLLSYGSKPAPLAAVGFFFDCLGNFLIDYIFRNFKKNILLTKTEVTSIKILSTDEFAISAKSTNCSLSFQIKTRILIMANGGKSYINQKNIKELNKIVKTSDFYTSDNVLQENGYNKLINNLNTKKDKRVVIIGGGHSAFSSALIILNGPSNYKHIGKEYILKKNSCENCSLCNFNCYLETPTNSIIEGNSITSQKLKPNTSLGNKNCTNECFGKVVYKNWKNDKQEYSKSLKNSLKENVEILILFRKHIRVYYHSEEEAHLDGYNEFEKSKAINKSGNVYPFIGIRGDAKELYRNIVRNREKKVKLIKSELWESQRNHINPGNIVIWACGYETQNITFYDSKNQEVEFIYTGENNMFEVDKELRILDKNKIPIKNLFGIGQGYSTFSTEIINGVKARADAVNLYNTHVAKKLFKSLDSILKTQENKYSGLAKSISIENKMSDPKIKSTFFMNLNMCEKPGYNININEVKKNPINDFNNKKSSSNTKIALNTNNQYYNLKNSQITSNSSDLRSDNQNKFLNNSSSNLNISNPNYSKYIPNTIINNVNSNIKYEFYLSKSPSRKENNYVNLVNSQNDNRKVNDFYSSYYKHLQGGNNKTIENKIDVFKGNNLDLKLCGGNFPILPKKNSVTNLNSSLYNNKRYNSQIEEEINQRKSYDKFSYNTPKINKTYNITNGKNSKNQNIIASTNKIVKTGYTNIY